MSPFLPSNYLAINPVAPITILLNLIFLIFAINMNGKEVKHCSLCYHNGEPEEFCSSHNLKTRDGRIVTCPVLRKFVCNLCGATGDNAHTLRYCPLNKDGVFNRGASLPQLKTRRNAAGNFSNRRMLCPPLHSTLRKEEIVLSQAQMLEAEARRLRARYFAPLPPAFPAHGSQTSGCGRAFSSPSFVNCSGFYSSSPESVSSNSVNSSPGRDAASPWMKPNIADAGSWSYRSSGGNVSFTSRHAGLSQTPKVHYYHDAAGEKVEDVGKLLAELRLGTTAVEM